MNDDIVLALLEHASTSSKICRPRHQPVLVCVPRFALPVDAPISSHECWVHGRPLRSYINPDNQSIMYEIDFGRGYFVNLPAGALETCVVDRELPMHGEDDGLQDMSEDVETSSANMNSNSEFESVDEMLAAKGHLQSDIDGDFEDFVTTPHENGSPIHDHQAVEDNVQGRTLQAANTHGTCTVDVGEENVLPCLLHPRSTCAVSKASGGTHSARRSHGRRTGHSRRGQTDSGSRAAVTEAADAAVAVALTCRGAPQTRRWGRDWNSGPFLNRGSRTSRACTTSHSVHITGAE